MLLAGTALYLAGTTLNDFADVGFDREHRKERPIPSGTLSRGAVGLLGLAYLLIGSFAALWGAQGSLSYLVSLLAAILLYDYWHKRWVGSVFFMGACRACLCLLAASCVTGHLGWPTWLHAGVLFGYIVGLTFLARGESRQEKARRWPLAFLFLPMPATIWLGIDSEANLFIVIAFALLNALAVCQSLRFLAKRNDPARIGKAVSLLLAGITLIDAAFLASAHWPSAGTPVALFVVACLSQRFIPAT